MQLATLKMESVKDGRSRDIKSAKRTVLSGAGATTKFPLLHEGDVQVCRITHQKSLASKILATRFLRRWEPHHLVLSESQLYSTNATGYMEYGVTYHDIRDVYAISHWDAGQKFCLRMVIPDGSLLLQAVNAYSRDQWMHSISWRVKAARYKSLFTKIRNPEELVKELKELVQFSLTTPVNDDLVFQLPLNTISSLLLHHGFEMTDIVREAILETANPLLDQCFPTPAICKCFQMLCKKGYRAEIVSLFQPSVQRILKQSMDFGKHPHLRTLAQDYFQVIYECDGEGQGIRDFVESVHTPNGSCPHPRVLPNIVSIFLAVIYHIYDERLDILSADKEKTIRCFESVIVAVTSYKDWVPGLATLFQAIPFPNRAFEHEEFSRFIRDIIKCFAEDDRCEVHQCLLPIREGRKGWVHLVGPDGICCADDGALFSHIMAHILPCCCKRKKVLLGLQRNLRGPFMLMAIRGDEASIEALTAILDFELLEDEEERLQVVAALRSSAEGCQRYEELCCKKAKFREMKQKGGPKNLTLPTKSTDADLARVLNTGSFGNLETLNLAFTRVTSACAEYLIQLPTLLHLNLWSTQFDDKGLQLIAEHLVHLQTLNLCETPVTDDGLHILSLMPNLKSLNLNSTKLSAITFECLKNKLKSLNEVDIRYTDAW